MNSKLDIHLGLDALLVILGITLIFSSATWTLKSIDDSLKSIDKSLKVIASPPVDEINQLSEKAAP